MITVGKLKKMLEPYPDGYWIDIFVMDGEKGVGHDVEAEITSVDPQTPEFSPRYLMLCGRKK